MDNSMGGSRKRLMSMGEESYLGPTLRKRPRMSSITSERQLQLMGGTAAVNSDLDRLPRRRVLHGEDFDLLGLASHARPLSGSSSFTTPSRATSPGDLGDTPGSSVFISRSGMALMRSVSSASLSSTAANTPTYPESSAKHHLRNTKFTIDFSVPPADNPLDVSQLVSCSSQNVLLFSRGNRVHVKNLTTSEEIGQLCKLQDSHGDLRIIQCAGADQPDVVALATSKGHIQIWDFTAKKKLASWSTKSATAMRWNGFILTIGGAKGTIRHYDTRITPTSKMKEQVRKVTRHQAKITSLEWNIEGKILASGDQSGTVYCWDAREKIPLDVGEFIQRRKKIQHTGAVSAIAWCPWQPKLLATGDVDGAVQLWNVNASIPHSNATTPGKYETGAPVTSLHFSSQCKEILSTHSMKPPAVETPSTRMPPPPAVWPKINVTNSIAVYSYPSLRHVTTLSVADKPIGTSVVNANGTKIVLTTPDDGKINLCDVWSKRKELKRQPSFLSSTIR
ncbi:Cell division cycle protein 20 [Hypsizygus marmoreus]|uniref:Cell division cycle protein 20 n=1 Tax=Hypsizygus marmoreus TaxID=39966 RepID=A0A369J6R5_HYPMA|nr:Cell division cycle protein 20 [Hypsizygus marmoreus]